MGDYDLLMGNYRYCRIYCQEVEGIDKVLRVYTDNNPDGVHITIMVLIAYGKVLFDVAKELQQKVAKQVEYMTAFNIMAVDIDIRGLE